MTPVEIKVALMRKGISQVDLARSMQVHRNAIYLVVHKRLASKRLMEAVAQAIGEPMGYVFPEYVNSERRHRGRPRKATNNQHLTG